MFQFSEEEGGGDWQMINSVYLDNSQMELYHGRLLKLPDAIALRIRWYGVGNDPKVRVSYTTSYTTSYLLSKYILRHEVIQRVIPNCTGR